MWRNLPVITRRLLVLNILVFLLQQWQHDAMLIHFALWPLGPDQWLQTDAGQAVAVGFRPWQLLSYAFLHGGLTHILFNMLALYMFGGTIERTLGSRRYLLYYLVCLLTAALVQLLVMRWMHGGFFPTLGASGAIFGLLLAFGVMYPREKVYFILIPVPLPAWLFVILYALAELVFGVTHTLAGVAHFAHLGGMLGGFILLQYWRGRWPIKPRQVLGR